ncbi:MAG: HTTM domain-containing protein, partial [Pirellulales bacterium]|nr:HTTM domain-containing protein [Pirellulales bacterium]
MSQPASTKPSSSGRLAQRLLQEVDSSILVWFRLVVGVTVFFWAQSFLADNKYVPMFLEPRFLFKYPGFYWVKLWPGEGIYWHFVITKVAAICLALGLLTRVSAAVCCLATAYVLLVERQIYVNHYYLLSCASALLVFMPAGRRFSIDALIGYQRRENTFPRWQLWLMRFQLGLPYVGGGIAKLNADWLAGQPAGIMVSQRTDLPVLGPLLSLDGAAHVLTFGGLFYDLLVVPMLLCRWTRWPAVGLSLIFHLTNAATLSIGVFPWFMLATLVVFFPVQTVPNRVRTFLGQPPVPPQPAMSQRKTTASTRAGWYLAGTYVVIQLLLPLRPWIFPGDA